MQENVTILGAGLGGLVLAGLLCPHKIDVVIYESEAPEDAGNGRSVGFPRAKWPATAHGALANCSVLRNISADRSPVRIGHKLGMISHGLHRYLVHGLSVGRVVQ